VGRAGLVIGIKDGSGAPVTAPYVQVEGDMGHAGMKPVFAVLKAAGHGRYEGAIDFDMGGDWSLLISGTDSSGRAFSTRVDVPGVRDR
jgi:hypothetical protein